MPEAERLSEINEQYSKKRSFEERNCKILGAIKFFSQGSDKGIILQCTSKPERGLTILSDPPINFYNGLHRV